MVIARTHIEKILLACSLFLVMTVQGQRRIQSLDKDWRFLKGDTTGAEKPSFNDAGWRQVDVPHDWMIEGPYDAANRTGRGGGYLPAGIGWYRKKLSLPNELKGRKIFVQFDGVMANSEVWINGNSVGKRPYGYSSFSYDLTPYVHFGKESNIISVKVIDSLQPASRYYTGAGIYRHTWLIATGTVHVANWGVFVTTPQVSAEKASVNIKAAIDNPDSKNKEIQVQASIVDKDGKQVASDLSQGMLAAGERTTMYISMQVKKPLLWDIEHPELYHAVIRVLSGKEVLDNVITTFGIRSIKWNAATGFSLNDRNLKLYGVCLHHDAGAVGAAVPLSIWEKRFTALKKIGVNAIRTSHNPVAPEFLDLCDRMGFLVMDEDFDTWMARKEPGDNGYNLYFKDWWQKDLGDQVMRDRNHPSIVIWSVGNEIHDNLGDSAGFKKYRDQQDLIHQLDGTRPVTMALFRPNVSHVYQNGFIEMMDVVGQNYRENELVAIHEQKPQMIVVGTENGHSRDAWLSLRDHPYVAGQFLWTGIDYLGEAVWPMIANPSGLIDKTGMEKPRGYERESWWSGKPMLFIVRHEANGGQGPLVPDWTPAEMEAYDEADVSVYSNCDEVELFLNGKSLGSKEKPADDAARSWKFTFEKGSLKAVGKNKGKVVAEQELKTAGAPAKIILKADQSKLSNDWNDVAFVTATVVDANGVVCPNADNEISFAIDGPGVIAAVDNGNNSSHESYQGNKRKAYKGNCVALIKANAANGKITIKASAAGLGDGSVSIEAVPPNTGSSIIVND